MKKQIDLARPTERRQLTHQSIPVTPVKPEKNETPTEVIETPTVEPTPAPLPTNSFSFITVLLIGIIVVMVGFIYYIFFLST